MRGICYIVGAGENNGLDFTPQREDFVIAADGGYMYLLDAKIRTDLIIADFDSLCEDELAKIFSKPLSDAEKAAEPESMSELGGTKLLRLKPEKDETDTFRAVRYGLEKGYRDFRIYCGTGGRTDHTAANIQTLLYIAASGGRGVLVGPSQNITAICGGSCINFDAGMAGFVSVFSAGDKAEGICIRGLKYPAENLTLTDTYPMGTSNEFTGKGSEISVASGRLIIVYDNKGEKK